MFNFSCKNSASSLSASSSALLLVPSNISLSSVINCSFSVAASERNVSPSNVVSDPGIGIDAYLLRINPRSSFTSASPYCLIHCFPGSLILLYCDTICKTSLKDLEKVISVSNFF